MIKLIVLAVGVWLVYSLLRGYQRKVDQKQAPAAPSAEDMVRCVRCGVHLPRSESILSQGSFYCSEQHRQLGRK